MDLYIEYFDRFGEPVPTEQMPIMTDEQLNDLIKKALEDNEPIELDIDENLIY